MKNFAICLAMLVTFSVSVFGQLDAYKLRNKYGPPLDRETFTIRPGIEMVVDYGPAKQVCRIQLPSGTQYGGTAPDGAVTKQMIEEVLQEVVPASMRGKVVNKAVLATGAPMWSTTMYEHVTITELTTGGVGEGITVTFKDAACPSDKVVNSRPPRRLQGKEPEYTEEARKAKIQGDVHLQIDIDASGKVSKVIILKSLGVGLDQNCLEAVRGWQFEAGKPTQGMNVECNFRLL